uniref:Uncharacterized protein n=1 Tax=Aegilops tauschii subsp. strangulata TaxID=200361 RepID=A0A453P6T9_AEGTS
FSSNSEEWKRYKRPPSEQEYSEDVSQLRHGLNVEPSREELNHLSKACCRLWELDLNRLLPGNDYRIECGQGKKVYQKGDMASENLFSWLRMTCCGGLHTLAFVHFFTTTTHAKDTRN